MGFEHCMILVFHYVEEKKVFQKDHLLYLAKVSVKKNDIHVSNQHDISEEGKLIGERVQ
jgi:hypothetical protein